MHSYESLVLRKAEQSQTRGCKKSVRGAGVTLLQKKVTVCLKERRGGAALTMSLSLGDLFSFLYMYILVATFFNSKVQQWPATRAIIIRTRLTTAACGINHPPPPPFALSLCTHRCTPDIDLFISIFARCTPLLFLDLLFLYFTVLSLGDFFLGGEGRGPLFLFFPGNNVSANDAVCFF